MATATTRKPRTAPKGAKPARAGKPRMTHADAMRQLEEAGTEQARRTYARHGATGSMFGVSFATLKAMMKRIGVDHELAESLWATGNLDAQNLAVKIADPGRMSSADLDRWMRGSPDSRTWSGYAAMLPAETAHGAKKAAQWLASRNERERASGWTLLGQLAQRDESMSDAEFARHVADIERTIHGAPNAERYAMNSALIAIGCRSAGLRRTAIAAARRIGQVEIDHGDTDCKTPDAAASIEKAWAHSTAKGFASPAAQERGREVLRRRC